MKLRISTSLLILLTTLTALAGTNTVPSFEQPVSASGDSSRLFRSAVYGRAQGLDDNLTWRTMDGFGVGFTENGGAFLGYRAIVTDYSKGEFGYDVTAHGPVIGAEFRF
ncbi:MAG: hypothetical protein J0M04_13205 [Verrucomicrobia bacterium]|nr:hypothetical protein [Verrucomicrobiota bacterium]